MLKRQFQVAPGRVSVFDDLLPLHELDQYCEGVSGASFVRSEFATPATQAHRHFVSEMPLTILHQLPILKRTLSAIAAHAASEQPYHAYRAYTNYAGFGEMLYSHIDCAPGSGELTALWYLCTQWDTEWGGETVFFEPDGDAVGLVSPRPGRLVIFDGDVRHVGRPPNRICSQPRFTFAIKFERVEAVF